MFPGQYSNHNQVARGITGGTLTSDSTYYYRTFLSSGSLSLTKGRILANVFGSGGGSGNNTGRGGSSGQTMNTTKEISRSKGTCTIVIGAGGSGPTAATSTTITDNVEVYTAFGAGFYISGNGFSSGTDSFAAGDADGYGGGGGAASNGFNGYSEFGYAAGGQGGFGISNPYGSATSTPLVVAGGGGGAANEYFYANGYGGSGVDGGGNGRGMATVATSGAVNTGSGGGGGSLASGSNSVGGSGILIIRYSKNGANG